MLAQLFLFAIGPRIIFLLQGLSYLTTGPTLYVNSSFRHAL